MADEAGDRAAAVVDVDENVEAKVEKVYSCKFCDKSFTNWQACGGHQNAHRRERKAIKQLQITSEFLAMPPPQPPLFPPFPPANLHQSLMFLQQSQLSHFAPPSRLPYPNHYRIFNQTPLPNRFQPYVRGGAYTRYSAPFSSSNMNANVGYGYPPQFGDGIRRGEESRRNYGQYEYGSTSRTGPTTGAVAMEGAPSSILLSNSAGVGSSDQSVQEDNENNLDLNLHL